MAITIASNIYALRAQNALTKAGQAQGVALERLSSGARINRASDDAAGLSIASALELRTRVYGQAVRNANDGISALNIAESALRQGSDILTRLKELAESAANGSFSRVQRLSLDREAGELVNEYNRILATTTFNGRALVDGSLQALALQVGFGSNGTLTTSVGSQIGRQRSNETWSSVSDGAGYFVDSAASISYADFNGDGKEDIISGDPINDQDLLVMLSNGDGTYQESTLATSTLIGAVLSTTIGDFNGDGKTDIAAAGYSLIGPQGGVVIALGNGDGTFGTPTSVYSGVDIDKIGAGDFDGDGDLDIVASRASSAGPVSLRNNSTSSSLSFASATYALAGFTTDIKLADIDGDGRAEIYQLTGGTGLRKLLFNGSALVLNDTLANMGGNEIEFGDFNRDGILDAAVSTGSNSIRHLRGTSSGNLTNYATLDAGTTIHSISVRDLNGDGLLDILGSSGASTTGAILYSDVEGSFVAGTRPGLSAFSEIHAVDVTGDGVPDLVGSITSDAQVRTFVSGTSTSTSIARLDLTTRQAALSSLDSISTLLSRLGRELGQLGASQSRLVTAVSVTDSLRLEFTSSRSRIVDADVAKETAEMTRSSIVLSAASAVLTQAKLAPALALELLREP